jgi:hypothetical protein
MLSLLMLCFFLVLIPVLRLPLLSSSDDVYGPDHKLLSQKTVDMMYQNSNETGYGYATFNLTRRSGVKGAEGVIMGKCLERQC